MFVDPYSCYYDVLRTSFFHLHARFQAQFNAEEQHTCDRIQSIFAQIESGVQGHQDVSSNMLEIQRDMMRMQSKFYAAPFCHTFATNQAYKREGPVHPERKRLEVLPRSISFHDQFAWIKEQAHEKILQTFPQNSPERTEILQNMEKCILLSQWLVKYGASKTEKIEYPRLIDMWLQEFFGKDFYTLARVEAFMSAIFLLTQSFAQATYQALLNAQSPSFEKN